MRFMMHKAESASPAPVWKRPVLFAGTALLFALACAVVVFIIVKGSALLGVATAVLLAGTTLLLAASVWDVRKAYVKIGSDSVQVVEYPFFTKKESAVPLERIAQVENTVNTVGFSPAPYLSVKDAEGHVLFALRASDAACQALAEIISQNHPV